MNNFFAKTLLGENSSPEKEEFISNLLQSARDGHFCLKTKNAPSLPTSIIEEGTSLFPKTPIVRDQDRYYIQKNWVFETFVLQQIQRLRKQQNQNLPLFTELLTQEEGLTPEQKEAVQQMFLNPFSIVCGGPGTGKTYTAAKFVRLLTEATPLSNLQIVVAAPTGKAALHLQTSLVGIDCEVSTLHRLLKLKPGETKLFAPRRIDADLILVDEASMMDVSLFSHLLESVGDETRLILLGDPNQLPPVEIGSLFAECAELFGIFLKRCMRTDRFALQQSATSILQGDEAQFFSSVALSENFDEDLVDSLYERIAPIISSEKIDPAHFLQESKRLRVLNALRQGPFGVDALNQKILEKMSFCCPEGSWWAVPILCTANMPHHNLSNGSFGVLIGQKTKRFQLSEGIAYFQETGDQGFVNPPPYELSFLLSIHKSQGSEFDEVIALFPDGSENFGKEALYTAATRAKKQWEVVGRREVICKMLHQSCFRESGLRDRIKCTL